ncbi:MAG: hypothetical protein HZB38_14990 [Planctomycetes bacterium]|nr:hypothetical protein [Planctomycetota bacterium]
MSALFTFYWQMAGTRQKAAEMSARTQLARNVLQEIERGIRSTVGFEKIGFPSAQGEQRLAGTRRNISFLTAVLPDRDQYRFYGASENPPPAKHDLRMVSYSLWVDPNEKTEEGEPIVGGIIRAEKKTLNQFIVNEDDPLDVRNDLLSPELGYLEFRYFDGVEWDTKWDITDGNSLPQLIQVTVGYKSMTQDEADDVDLQTYPVTDYPFGDPVPHDDRYTVIVRVPSADRYFGSRVSRVGKQYSEQLGVTGDALK